MRSDNNPINAINTGLGNCDCEKLKSDLKRSPRHRSELKGASLNMNLTPDKMPDPWLFDSEKLLRELDRCREMMLLVPITTAEHKNRFFQLNIAIDALWNLRETLRYLLSIHHDGQRAFAKKADSLKTPQPSTVSKRILRHERPKSA